MTPIFRVLFQLSWCHFAQAFVRSCQRSQPSSKLHNFYSSTIMLCRLHSVMYMLLLTLPVTVATCERSFSKLKFVKNYLRSTMSEERLTDLAMLSIENERAKKLDTSKVVDIFAQEKTRRRMFLGFFALDYLRHLFHLAT